jgi:hypothetical protein
MDLSLIFHLVLAKIIFAVLFIIWRARRGFPVGAFGRWLGTVLMIFFGYWFLIFQLVP